MSIIKYAGEALLDFASLVGFILGFIIILLVAVCLSAVAFFLSGYLLVYLFELVMRSLI